jgi:DNA invertase Pin-like site-specific DNA recombinase
MNVVGYCRVSSRAQNLATQRDAIQRAARAQGLRINVWYEDRVSSARTRPELERLLGDARGGRVGRVYVYRLDRLTRNGIRDTLRIIESLHQSGATIETVADGIRLGGSESEIVIAVLGWAAQMERSAIGERIASARQRVEAAGGTWGRPRRIDDDVVTRIRAMRPERTIREISIALKIPRSTVSDVLSEKGCYSRASKTAKKPGVKKARPQPTG